ncbi:MAG: glycerophosphodiester phosphodiesterase [Anaerolineae bacterium]|nr:glycerophosphodiester phosphodiesterase [Anaerolineae bacterium]
MAAVLDAWFQGPVHVSGHRGARAYAPMNTVPSFELAVAQGADSVELDVHRSKDGYPVICHDFTVDATTDGSGRVTDKTLAELKELDAGSWFGDAFRDVHIPTLDEVFEAVGHKVYVNVEIKSNSVQTDGVETLVAEVITRHGLTNRVIVSSFNPLALQRFRAALPEVPIAFIYEANMTIDTVGLIEQLGVPHEARHPHHSIVDAAYIAWAKSKGYRVNAWTVNDPTRAVELRDLGVDTITTDAPDVILNAVRGS